MDITDFILLHKIGQGGFASVSLVKKKEGIDASVLYAMKIIDKSSFTNNKHLALWCKREQEVCNNLAALYSIAFIHCFYSYFRYSVWCITIRS